MSKTYQNLVTMQDGTKRPIESLHVGDKVKGLNSYNTVVAVGKPGVDIRPVMTEHGWAAVDPLALAIAEPETYEDIVDQQGYPALEYNDNWKLLTELGYVGDVELCSTNVEISLDGDHTYYLNGVLVHNGGKGGSKKTTVVNNNYYNSTTTVNQAPPPSRVITSGRINTVPAVETIGSTTITYPPPDFPSIGQSYIRQPSAWTTTPYIPRYPSAQQFNPGYGAVSPSRVPQVDISRELLSAFSNRDAACDAMLSASSNLGRFNFRLTGNGGAVRWRFLQRGIPVNVVVYNASTNEVISSGDYTIVPRGDSFAWIEFDSAVASGTTYLVTYEAGDAGTTVKVQSSDWQRWNNLLNDLKQRIRLIKTDLNNGSSSRSRGWGLSDPTLLDGTIQATDDLKSAIGRPGGRMNLDQISKLCTYLDNQLQSIDRSLYRLSPGRAAPIGPVTPVAPPPVRPNPDRIYSNDPRFAYMSALGSVGGAECYGYKPPSNFGAFCPAIAQAYDCYRFISDPRTGQNWYEPTGAVRFSGVC